MNKVGLLLVFAVSLTFGQQADTHAAQATAGIASKASTENQKCLAVYPVAGNKKNAAAVGLLTVGVGFIGMHGEYFVYVGSAGLSIADTKSKYSRKDLVKLENSGVRIVVSPNKVDNQSADVHVTVGSDELTNPCRVEQ